MAILKTLIAKLTRGHLHRVVSPSPPAVSSGGVHRPVCWTGTEWQFHEPKWGGWNTMTYDGRSVTTGGQPMSFRDGIEQFRLRG